MRKFVFSSPRKYVQGNGVIAELGQFIQEIGKKAFLIADDTVWTLVSEEVMSALSATDVPSIYARFNGESSGVEINRLATLAQEAHCDVVVGLGGGKTLDTAKAVADTLGAAVAIVPTVASTDAPCSALSVIYTEDGAFDSYRFYTKNPDLVLVDSAICVRAPARLFASGIADGMATYIEARAVQRSQSLSMVNGTPTVAAMAIAEACENTLLTYGYSALQAVEQNLVTPAVEAVIEANTLLSGLGFENAGLAGAHAIHNGFTALQGDIHHLTHGEKVAYGILVQLVLENRPDSEIADYIDFFRSIGMPVTLKGLHLADATREELLKVGELANSPGDTLRNLNPNLTAGDIADAILAVNALSHAV